MKNARLFIIFGLALLLNFLAIAGLALYYVFLRLGGKKVTFQEVLEAW
jgi:hypothetical protein